MLNAQVQCMSIKKLSFWASVDFVFLNNAITSKIGETPNTQNKMIPSIKKLLNGELLSIDNGIPINFPFGEMIKTKALPTAHNARNANKNR